MASYTARLGFQPAVYNLFLPLPLLGNTTEYLQTVLPQISQEQAIAMLTVMPMEGLSAVTETAVAELAYQIQVAQEVRPACSTRVCIVTASQALVVQAGASVMIRFAHEMNGASSCCLLNVAYAGSHMTLALLCRQLVRSSPSCQSSHEQDCRAVLAHRVHAACCTLGLCYVSKA